MRFGEVPLAEAEGAILAHSVKHPGGIFKKGRVLTPSDIAVLQSEGIATVFAAKLAPDDIALPTQVAGHLPAAVPRCLEELPVDQPHQGEVQPALAPDGAARAPVSTGDPVCAP